MSSVEPRLTILNALDRCDVGGCTARAYVRGLFEPQREDQETSAVDLCGHHFRGVSPSFHEQAYHVIDETDTVS